MTVAVIPAFGCFSQQRLALDASRVPVLAESQTKSEKKEEDRAKLLWYHKVYEDHLRSQFLSKRSGENTENRRVAHAASRRFAAELSERENELDSSIVQATKASFFFALAHRLALACGFGVLSG